MERGIQRPAGANDVNAVRKSRAELLKYLLFIARDTFIGLTFPGDFYFVWLRRAAKNRKK